MGDLILDDGAAMRDQGYMPLPPGWIGVIGEPRWAKPYGWCSRSQKVIEVHAPAWIPAFMRGYFERITWTHEALHAWGSRGCANVWCLGYEGATWKEYLAMPVQLLAGLRFCDVCRSYGPRAER